MEARFDWIRDLVLRDTEPTEKYYTIDQEPVLDGDKRDGVRLFGHFLVLEQIDGRLVGTVSLFNRFRHRITLAAHETALNQGHFFEIATRRIFSIADIAELLKRIALRTLPHANVPPSPGPK